MQQIYATFLPLPKNFATTQKCLVQMQNKNASLMFLFQWYVGSSRALCPAVPASIRSEDWCTGVVPLLDGGDRMAPATIWGLS